jgi:hypothetical protein
MVRAMLSNKPYNNIFRFLIILCIIFVSYKGIYHALEAKSGLWAYDSGEDEFALVGGMYFADNGFLSNAGLWYRCWKDNKRLLTGRQIGPRLQTKCLTRAHYPPLPAWIAGLLIKIIGEEKIETNHLHYFRFFPVTIGIISFILFAYMTVSAFNIVKATIIIAAVSTVEVTSNMMGHLGMHGYVIPLFILQLGFFLYIFKKEEKFKIRYCIILFFLGFLQGWLSYDLFFVVSFSGIPFALLYANENKSESTKRLFYAVIFPLAGFGFAHILHFIQFAIYYGSISAAYNDIISIAKYRAQGGSQHFKYQLENAQGSDISRMKLLNLYLSRYIDSRIFLANYARPLKKIIIFIFFMTLFKDVRINIKRPFQVLLKWTSSYSTSFAVLSAFLISILWILVMPQFSGVKELTPFVTRHFFLIYFVCVLTIVDSLSLENNGPSAEHESKAIETGMQ